MKTYILLDRLKRSRDSGSALYNMHPTDVLGRAGGGNLVWVSEIKGVSNLSTTTTPWVYAKKTYTQGVDTMLIVSKYAEGMSLRYAVPEACRYVMM